MPTNRPGYIKQYYKKNKSKWLNPEERRKKGLRTKARRAMVKKHGKAALAGKDIDHRRPLRKGGTSSLSNLRIMSRRKNRSMNGK